MQALLACHQASPPRSGLATSPENVYLPRQLGAHLGNTGLVKWQLVREACFETGSMAMSENPEDKPGSGEQLPDTQPTAPHLRRRLFIFKAAAVLGVTAAAVLGASREALA